MMSVKLRELHGRNQFFFYYIYLLRRRALYKHITKYSFFKDKIYEFFLNLIIDNSQTHNADLRVTA